MKESIINLLNAANELDSDKIQLLLRQILPTYQPRYFSQVLEKNKINTFIKAEA